jgi:hypothetical protein
MLVKIDIHRTEGMKDSWEWDISNEKNGGIKGTAQTPEGALKCVAECIKDWKFK